MISRRARTDLLAGLVLSLIFLVFVADVLFGSRDFFIRDLTRYYHPTKLILREIVLSGEFPWWNPYYSAGQPMAANPEYEVFYPLQWLILLPDYELGYRLHILVHIWLTAIGMFALLRSMRLGVGAALFGAIAWGFGGVTFSLVNLLPILFAAAWLPLILLFVRRMLRRFTLRDAGLASIAGGMQILVGEPTTLIQTWLIVGFYALWRMTKLRRRGWRALVDPAAIVLIALAGSIAIGAVQLIPAASHAGETVRSRGFDLDLITAWSFPPQRFLEWAHPHLFGRVDVDGRTMYWAGSGLYGRPASPFLFSIYSGLLVFSVMVAGWTRRRSGQLLWLMFIVPFLVIAMGRHTPLFAWVHDLGVSIPFRYPEKFMLSVILAMVVFASVQFARIERGDVVLAKRAGNVALSVAALATVIVTLGFTPIYGDWFERLWGVSSSKFLDSMLAASRLDWAVVLAVSLANGLLLRARASTLFRIAWVPLALLVLVIDLYPVALDVSPRIQRSFFADPPLVADLDPDRSSYRIFHEVDWYGRSKTARSWFATGRGVYWVVRNGLFPMTPANHRFHTVLERDYDRTALLPAVDLVQSMWDVRDRGQKQWASIFMGMSNARYRSHYRDPAEGVAAASRDMRSIDPVQMIDEGPAPRYYFAESIIRTRSRQEFVDELVAAVPPDRTAFVDLEAFEPAPARVTSFAETSSSIELNVEVEGRALLVLSVTPHEYWTARVDGAERELHVVNVGYQGLLMDQGERRVELVYRNPLIVATAPVSAGSFLLAMLAIVAGGRARGLRRRAEPDANQE